MQNKVVLITGASSGIGLNAAKKLLSLGYTVYGAARRTELLSEIENNGGYGLYLDLTSSSSISECVDNVIKKEGRIDILINNAGYGLGGCLEYTDIEKAKNQFQVNLFGLADINRLVLPVMRKNHSGKIINVSSIAGKFSSPFLGWYHASKYALEAYSDALRMEVKSFGIDVVIIEPGIIQTNWGIIARDTIIKNTADTPYEEKGRKTGAFYDHYYSQNGASAPDCVVKSIVSAIKAKHPAIRYKTGKYARLFTFAAKMLPECLLDTVVNFVYKL